MPNGMDCCNNQTLLICVATIPFDWMGLNCYINGHENMSHMMCNGVS